MAYAAWGDLFDVIEDIIRDTIKRTGKDRSAIVITLQPQGYGNLSDYLHAPAIYLVQGS